METRGLVSMMMKRPLLLMLLLLQLVLESQALRHSNSYFYQDLSPDGKGNGESMAARVISLYESWIY